MPIVWVDYPVPKKEGSISENDINLTELYYSPVKCEEVAKESSRDPVLSKIIRYTQFGWPENNTDNKQSPFFNRKYELSVERCCLVWGARVIIPSILRERIL